ncbi:methylamine utilization protein MauJ [Thalassospira xiamenensis]|uniref:methylamine utilization protein MauJ n=1 Tax=Thalassospira xiamenensis TaxID=220697 RepID=UPI0020003C1E|nr:methylamine utilization protein MauJ [Thalassospira xiamenensis]MCK2168046.1 hypothetical protein [Thalassospira xiamenensis]
MASGYWLNLPVMGYGEWTDREQVIWINFKEFTILPLKKDNQASIHIDLNNQKIQMSDAITLMNTFLSHLSWCSGQAYWTTSGFSGSAVKISQFDREQRMLFSGCLGGFPDCFELTTDPVVANALAFYRHGKLAERYSLADSCLSYYKILEIIKRREGTDKLDQLINQKIPYMTNLNKRCMAFIEDKSSQKGISISKFLFKEVRNQAAHYLKDSSINLDNEDENELFKYAVNPMHDLARCVIKETLNTDDYIYAFSYHKNSMKFFEEQEKGNY